MLYIATILLLLIAAQCNRNYCCLSKVCVFCFCGEFYHIKICLNQQETKTTAYYFIACSGRGSLTCSNYFLGYPIDPTYTCSPSCGVGCRAHGLKLTCVDDDSMYTIQILILHLSVLLTTHIQLAPFVNPLRVYI